MSARVAILVFPGTNSEEETLRACVDVGLEAELILSPDAQFRFHSGAPGRP